MRGASLLVFLLFNRPASAQCGSTYPSGFWHVDQRVIAPGDTVNGEDGSGLYHGRHVYSMDRRCLIADTISYLTGSFAHGKPTGIWMDHCEDGSYSLGHFAMGDGEQHQDSTGKWVRTEQGLYNKTGIWRYFSSDSVLLRTERYRHSRARAGGTKWRSRTEVLGADGRWITTGFIRNGAGPYQSPSHRRLERTWRADGTPVRSSNKRAHGSVTRSYHPDGALRSKTRCGWSPWYFHHRCVTRSFTEDGRLIQKGITIRPPPPVRVSRCLEENGVF